MKYKNYMVTYEGLWLGGCAVVRAKSKKDAIEMVRNDNLTVDFNDVEVEVLDDSGVLYNDNGDY